MATYIPAPYDPMQQAMMQLGQSLGRVGMDRVQPLLGNYTQAQRQTKDNQSMAELLMDPNSDAGQLVAQRRFQSGEALLPGQAHQGELGTQLPTMHTQQGQAMLQQLIMNKMMSPLQLAQIQQTQQATRQAKEAFPEEMAGARAGRRETEARTGQIGKLTPAQKEQVDLEGKRLQLARRKQATDDKHTRALIKTEAGKQAYYLARAQGESVPSTEFERNISGLPEEQQLTARLIRLGLEPGNAKVRQLPTRLLNTLQYAREAYFARRDEPGWNIDQLRNQLYSQDTSFENYRAQIDKFFEGLYLEEDRKIKVK